MDLKALREKHSDFVYEKFEYQVDSGILKIKFHFHLEPNIDFYPTLEIPLLGEAKNLDSYIFNLGLMEMISYWKATCPPNIIIKAGHLSEDQINWWKDLLINGLGEFFYQNQINFTEPNFLNIKISSDKRFWADENKDSQGDLILIGGGKDSAVTLEILRNQSKKNNVLLLNPTMAAIKTTEVAGFIAPIIVTRQIDPQLLQLNKLGYLNGHTPFSAYLSFLSTLVAKIYNFKNIIVSNEQSAGEASLEYLGLLVNHQYSKSYRYEALFRDYLRAYINKDINYFSFLRPLTELQIAALFLQAEKYDLAFNSCNVGRGNYWCGECPKCAFVYLIFSALSDTKRLKKIFGQNNFFENEKIQSYIKDLTGDGKHKPLDCVGSEEESKMALELIKNPNNSEILNRVKNDWSLEHFLPKEYEEILKEKLSHV